MQSNLIPLSGIGTWVVARHFSPAEYAELARDYQMLELVEQAHIRGAHADAARNGLTVLSATPAQWLPSIAHDESMLLRTYLRVIYEPQADRKLIGDVARALAKTPDLWHPGGYSPGGIAEVAVRAVRDLGRLTASAPRPDGIPE